VREQIEKLTSSCRGKVRQELKSPRTMKAVHEAVRGQSSGVVPQGGKPRKLGESARTSIQKRGKKTAKMKKPGGNRR